MARRPTRTGKPKSRAGCFKCKDRHVRCDEARPRCGDCDRLILTCVYPLAPVARPALQHQYVYERILLCAPGGLREVLERPRMGRHLQSPEDTARAVVYAAFATLGPIGGLRSDFFSQTLTSESQQTPCYKYICLAIRDLACNPALRSHGFMALRLPTRDPNVLSALKHYTYAMYTFRNSLQILTPRDIAHGTMCFAMLELMQGNMPARDVILFKGLALLQPSVVTETRQDGSVRYGIHPRYGDCPSVCNSEGSIVRFAAASVLSRPWGFRGDVEARCGRAACQTQQHNLPLFCMPTKFPSPASHDTIEVLRLKWRTFHDTLESWLLSLYWSIAAGAHLDSLQHIAAQQRFVDQLEHWHLALRNRGQPFSVHDGPPPPCSSSSATYSPHSAGHNDSVTSSFDCDTLTALRTYIQFYRLILAVSSFDGATADDASCPGTGNALILQDFNTQGLQALIAQRHPELDGFVYSGSNFMFFDMVMMPVIAMQAATRNGLFYPCPRADSCSDSAVLTNSVARLIVMKQLALADLQHGLVIAEYQRQQGKQDKRVASSAISPGQIPQQLSTGKGESRGGGEKSEHQLRCAAPPPEDFQFMPMSARERVVVAVMPALIAMTRRHLGKMLGT
ncbi:RNA polymerase II-specific transcription factor-like protein [Microdochium nivale]|nr:RNA polymerase II-specific transcription factor-like protein [Microdochium nivale]